MRNSPRKDKVEDRLNKYKEYYENHKEDLKSKFDSEINNALKNAPQIDPNSKQIAESNVFFFTFLFKKRNIGKIEDRLIFSGKKIKAKKENAIILANNEIIMQAQPFILENSKKNMQFKSFDKISEKNVIDRLYEAKKKYELKRREKEQEILDQSCSFTPYISRKSIIRSKSVNSMRKPAKSQVNFTFHPELNQKSIQIAVFFLCKHNKKSLKGSPTSRILSNKKSKEANLSVVLTFKPEINSNSARLLQGKNRRNSEDRCKELYKLGKEIEEKKTKKRQESIENKLKEEKKQATFRPILFPRFTPELSETAAAVSAMLSLVQKGPKPQISESSNKNTDKLPPKHIKSESQQINPTILNKKISVQNRPAKNEIRGRILKETVLKKANSKNTYSSKDDGKTIGYKELVKNNTEVKDAIKNLHEELMSIPHAFSNIK